MRGFFLTFKRTEGSGKSTQSAMLARRLCVSFLLLLGWLSSAAAQTTAPTDPQALTLAEALDLYATLTGRTLLRPGNLSELPNAITNQLPADTNLAAAWIVGELSRNGIEVLPEGTVFARALAAEKKTPALEAQLAALCPAPLHDATSATNRIDFPAVDLNRFLDFYSEFSGRTLLRPAALPPSLLHLQTRQPLTPEETVYAFKMVLALSGVALVDDGPKLAQVVPLGEGARVHPSAPVPAPGAELVDPASIPVFEVLSPRGLLPSSPRATVDRLVAYYASLTGRTAVASAQFGHLWISFRARNSLTKAELLYALETTLTLNNLTILKVDDQTIRAGHISEGNRLPKGLLKSSPRP